MRLDFDEWVDLPCERVYAYMRSPGDWPRLYRAFTRVSDRRDGWQAVHLRRFPIPLVVRIVEASPERVHWRFRGFWRGEGEVRLTAERGGVSIRGFEEVSPAGLGWLAPLVERILKSSFKAIWASGFRRLRKEAAALAATHGTQAKVFS